MQHHGAGLRRLLTAKKVSSKAQEELVAALSTDYRQAELAAADRAMLDYAMRLTRHPWEISEADVERLREQGFDDIGIHDVCAVSAYFGFVNRIADGLGVDLEGRFDNNR